MKIWLKSCLPLAIINLIPILLFLLLLEIRFIVPLIACLIGLNIYLFFVFPYQILKLLPTKSLPPHDPWQVQSLLKKLKPPKASIEFYKIKEDYPISLCFGSLKKQYIVFSESLLELLSPQELELLLSYHITSISRGNCFALTLWSGLIYFHSQILLIFNLPFQKFKKQPASLNIFMVFILSLLSPLIKPLFFELDSQFKEKNKEWALLIWKLELAYQLEKILFPVFLAPLFPCNPLTNLKRGCYVSLQPKIKLRVKKLIGSYPP